MFSVPLNRAVKEAPLLSCVYKLSHPSTERVYIGRTNNLNRRCKEHYKKLLNNKHSNPKMQNLHNKYGDYWTVSVVFIGDVASCTDIEQQMLEAVSLTESLNCHASSVGGVTGASPSKEKTFLMLDWSVKNGKTRDEAISHHHCSWGSLKKYLPEWEATNGKLQLPLRATGEKSGNYKHGLSKELRRKKTEQEVEQLRQAQSQLMSGENNPMFGKTHSEEARLKISQAAKRGAQKRKDSGFVVSQETCDKISKALKGKPKPQGSGRRIATKALGGKAYDTPFGIFYTSKECEEVSGVKAATIMWRCKNNYQGVWGYIKIKEEENKCHT